MYRMMYRYSVIMLLCITLSLLCTVSKKLDDSPPPLPADRPPRKSPSTEPLGPTNSHTLPAPVGSSSNKMNRGATSTRNKLSKFMNKLPIKVCIPEDILTATTDYYGEKKCVTCHFGT